MAVKITLTEAVCRRPYAGRRSACWHAFFAHAQSSPQEGAFRHKGHRGYFDKTIGSELC
jgi:hypothetical protein